MKKVLIYSGTTEGRMLAKCLENASIPCDVSVATEYGRQVMEETSLVKVLEGRLSVEQMKELYDKNDYAAVVDATHPFATLVTDSIQESLKGTELPYIRLERNLELDESQALLVNSVEDAVDYLKKTTGNILLTTGSKDLKAFCSDEQLRSRIVARVLPGLESIQLCYEAGLEGKQIIAMQGPFSKEMNLAQIREYQVEYLITKESGLTGGVDTKLEACSEAGINCLMIKRPENIQRGQGIPFDEVCKKLEAITGCIIEGKKQKQVCLLGIGPGRDSYMTGAAKTALEEADLIFGAQRMLDCLPVKKEAYPYYLAKDIIPCMENHKQAKKIVVLFSGDTGFYSGAEKLYKELMTENKYELTVLPGISSLSYFAAKLGISYQDAICLSAHGIREELWKSHLHEVIKSAKKCLMLTSGRDDIEKIRQCLLANKNWSGRLVAGCNLSYNEEEIIEIPLDTKKELPDGIYVAAVLTDEPVGKICGPYHRDEEFLRAKVPMTKEEVRHLSICKLRLTRDAVCYDIGSGSGSIAIEMADLSSNISVYAIETNPEALSLINDNCKAFGLFNIEVIEGMAPLAFQALPVPSHAFIGGSKGNLEEILQALMEKNPNMRVVMNAVSLESVCQMQELLTRFPVEDVDITQVSVAKSKELGNYHMMTANNPVFIFSFTFSSKK